MMSLAPIVQERHLRPRQSMNATGAIFSDSLHERYEDCRLTASGSGTKLVKTAEINHINPITVPPQQ